MKRTIVSLPLDENSAKDAMLFAKKNGMTRTEYLRDIIQGHIRMDRMRALQEKVAKRGGGKNFNEEQVVEFVQELRRDRMREKEVRV